MSQLGQFEQDLLTELRGVVSEQATKPQPRRALPRKRLTLTAAGGGLLAAGLLFGLPALNGDQAPAAYAVTDNDDGTVTVRIISLEDAEGLERQLEAHGISAEIDYNPLGKMCRSLPSRYEELSPPPGAFKVDITRDDPGPPREWTLRPAALEGMTLVMEADGDGPNEYGEPLYGINLGFADGPVAPCVVVDR